MTVWIEPIKMVAISSALWLLLCVIAILLVSVSERSFVLFTPVPKWPAFLPFHSTLKKTNKGRKLVQTPGFINGRVESW